MRGKIFLPQTHAEIRRQKSDTDLLSNSYEMADTLRFVRPTGSLLRAGRVSDRYFITV